MDQARSPCRYLWDAATGNWSVSKNVRNVFVKGNGGTTSEITIFHNEFMTAAMDTPASVPFRNAYTNGTMTGAMKASIGPELGIGFALGNYTSEPVMCLKTCIGNRALGWDLLPPGTKSWTYGAWYAKAAATMAFCCQVFLCCPPSASHAFRPVQIASTATGQMIQAQTHINCTICGCLLPLAAG